MLGIGSFASDRQTGRLLRLQQTEVQAIRNRLDRDLLPDGAKNLAMEEKQVFNLISKDAIDLVLAPVKFDVPSDSIMGKGTGSATGCGLYVLPKGEKARFAWIVGKEEELSGLVQCSGLQAMGLQEMGDTYPELILIYEEHTVHDTFSQAYAFSWDTESRSYVDDKEWDERIAAEREPPTVRSVKRLISQGK